MKKFLGVASMCAVVVVAGAAENPLLKDSSCIEACRFRSFPAFRITDGKTAAVIVPELAGRVMEYGAVGGSNLLWNAAGDRDSIQPGIFKNWGGDKTLVGPHSAWLAFAKSLWPPPPSWLGEPHTAQVSNGMLVTTSPVWEGFQVTTRREYSFTPAGELAIRHTLTKSGGEARQVAVWSVAQTVRPDAVYVLRNPQSRYIAGFVPTKPLGERMNVAAVGSNLLVVTFGSGGAMKVSFDSRRTALAGRFGQWLWLQRGLAPVNPAESEYYNVEIYTNGDGPANYVELELLSPLVWLRTGEAVAFTTYWSLHPADGKQPVEQLFLNAP